MKRAEKLSLNNKDLIKIYKRMLEIRNFEEQVYYLFLQGILNGTIHQCQGQEAVSTGVCYALNNDDYIASTHRPHGDCIAKGLSLKDAMAELFFKETGCCKAKGGSMHFADASSGIITSTAVIGESIVLGTGMALAFNMKKTNQVAVSFFGDGASNSGSFHEALNMAAIWNLPVIFVCINNQYSASTSIETMISVENISERACAYNIPGVTVDGMDVLEVYKAAKEAVERARANEGPTLIECNTYRFVGHSRNDPAQYQPKEEFKKWKEKDPIKQFREELLENEVISDTEADKIEQEVETNIEDIIEQVKEDPEPELKEALEDV